jgi:hypothetical protein
MKLATLHDGRRDGRLHVVSRDGRHAVAATAIAPTLIHALEHWAEVQGPPPDEAHGIDFEGEFGVIVDEVPMGATDAQGASPFGVIDQRVVGPRAAAVQP